MSASLGDTLSSSEAEAILTLTQLGLTLNQSRIYWNLIKLGTANAKEISKAANITRQDVYRVMPTLQKAGLVEKIIAVPTEFKAVPIKLGISLLLKRKTLEYAQLRKSAKKLSTFSDKHQEKTIPKESEFILIPEREAILNRIKIANQKARKSLDIITSKERFSRAALEFFDLRMKALKRGVKIRLITEKPTNMHASIEKVLDVEKRVGVEIKYLSMPPPAVVQIIDGEEVLIMTSAKSDMAESPALWSNNPCLLALAQSYFLTMWNSSTYAE
ncbi:MAG: hypothetical protein NWE99_05420 [Candidatus Bathyarchaeota archaeon]|nr:hypothetical protein [Candidatus Bathyarchaeota archaeon]